MKARQMMISRSKARRHTTRDARWYEIETEDGARCYPSVTTILQAVNKPALLQWMAKTERELVTQVAFELYEDTHGCAKMTKAAWLNTLQARLGKEKAGIREARKAAEIGTQVHALIEWTLRKELDQAVGEEPRLDTEAAQTAFVAWLDWRESVSLKPLAIEQTVWSHEARYAGTLDLMADVNGTRTVCDWKSGKAIYPEAKLQLAAYAHAVIEMGHAEPPLPALVVRLPKVAADPGFEAVPVPASEQPKLYAAFLAVRHVWDFLEANKIDFHKPAKRDNETDRLAQELLESIAKAKSRGDVRELLETHGGLLAQIEREAPARKAEIDAFALAWQEETA